MSKSPNILWYCTDQQRFDTIHALGNSFVKTPVLDSLVKEGTSFTHTYCQSPICTPSRASFMSGLYPSRVHNTRNGNESFPGWPPVITKLIADAGYDCGLIGKFHLQSSGKRTEPRIEDGFSFWKFSHAPRDDWEEGHDYADWVRNQGGDLNKLRESEDRVPTELHQTTWASERSIEFIQQEREKPWLLNVNIYDPHPPFTPPKSYADQFDPNDMPGPHFKDSDLDAQAKLAHCDFQDEVRTPEEHDAKGAQARYYAMIAQIDDQFGRILKALEESGQRENTVIIFTSDHGESLGDHGLMYKGCRFYEGLVRVPLIFSWPGNFIQNSQNNALVEMLDLSATLLNLDADMMCAASRGAPSATSSRLGSGAGADEPGASSVRARLAPSALSSSCKSSRSAAPPKAAAAGSAVEEEAPAAAVVVDGAVKVSSPVLNSAERFLSATCRTGP